MEVAGSNPVFPIDVFLTFTLVILNPVLQKGNLKSFQILYLSQQLFDKLLIALFTTIGSFSVTIIFLFVFSNISCYNNKCRDIKEVIIMKDVLDSIKDIEQLKYYKIQLKVNTLQEYENAFFKLAKNDGVSIQDKIKKAKQIIKSSNIIIKYPEIELSNNWLILKSQLNQLADSVINTMTQRYIHICDVEINELQDLNHSKQSQKRLIK